ncbi:unnamed protein product [Effrenium voratum]|nr:unnamed protein product [Effrenium voratum]
MASTTGGYGADGPGPKFVKLSGEEIPYKAPANSRVRAVTQALTKFFPGGSVRLIDESGRVLCRDDPIPSAGTLQVQVMGIAAGQWSSLYFAALDGFDEDALRRELQAAWPGDYDGPEATDDEMDGWQNSTFEALQPAVLKCCGEWADYWTFGSAACSYGYWYVRPPYNDMKPSVELIITDLKRWQKILVDLEDEFAQLRSRCSAYELSEHLETAIAQLLRHCPAFATDVPWHVGFEMWYQPFADLVGWYLSSTGLEETHLKLLETVTNAIRGFQSYSCPPDTALAVVRKVAPAYNSKFEQVDSTSDWLGSRAAMVASTAPPVEGTANEDSHLRFIDSVDAARDSKRAADLRYALDDCRKTALTGVPLDLSHLTRWQSFLLGESRTSDLSFRQHDAYAKQGRERYPFDENTESKFRERLAEANSDEPLALRACRAYLDVCFFHPFEDCNSRMARLVFDFLLTQAGYALSTSEPIFMFARSARDAEGAKAMVQLVESLLTKPGTDWGKPLASWVQKNPPKVSQKLRWFSCFRWPEDNQDFLH